MKQDEIIKALGEIQDEIGNVKQDAETFKKGLNDVSPDELTYDDGGEDGMDVDNVLPEEDKEKAKEIKTPEDAKKVLDEAKKDITDVIEHLDGMLGQAEGEGKDASVTAKRISSKYANDLKAFADEVDTAVTDARQALKHWAFIFKIRKTKVSSIQDNSLRKAAQSVEDVAKLKNVIDRLFKKEATEVPPTRSDFSGDKWPDKGNPALVELRAWEAGASEFDKDKNREDARPNPAIDDRLQDKANPHDEKPHVNARFVGVENNKYASYWDIFDSKTKKRIVASFVNLPASVTQVKNDIAFKHFANKQYGDSIINNVLARGIGNVAVALCAQEARPPLKSFAAGKEDLRKYYTDAFGSSEYADELTSGADNSKMEEGYTPKDNHPSEKHEETKDGPGKLSKKINKLNKSIAKNTTKLDLFQKTASTVVDTDGKLLTEKLSKKLAKKKAKVAKLSEKLAKKFPNFIPKKKKDKDGKKKKTKEASTLTAEERSLLKVKADQAIRVARRFAASGAIPFVKQALLDKGAELLNMTEEQFKIAEQTINMMPITNVAALKEAHIPDTEHGIVGNKSEGVTNPKSKVKTEDINPSVKSDANISKEASFVPQMQPGSGGAVPNFTAGFNTVANRLQKLGIRPAHTAKYKQF